MIGGSPSKRSQFMGGNGVSPNKAMRSPVGAGNRAPPNWNEIIKKEQEKLIKQKQYLLRQHQGDPQSPSKNIQIHEEDDQNDQNDYKHPYVDVCIDKDIFNRQYLIKTSMIPQQSLKDFTHKEKNLITDLPDSQNQILYNGIECSLKKIFGQYQHPINKSIHFISNQTILFFTGYYLAMHNVVRDETKYIGIDSNLSQITAFEVHPIDLSSKAEKLSLSPTRQQLAQQLSYQESTITTNASPQQRSSLAMHSNDTKEARNTPATQQQQNPNNIQQNQANQHQKDMMTIIAFAEKAKETHLKEQKFQSKKVYGIQNSKVRKQQNTLAKSQSPVNMRNTTTINFFPNSPGKQSSVFKGDSEFFFNLEEIQNVKYLVKVSVFTLANPNKKYILQHFFDEYFYVQQISIRDRESLCYTLCTNSNGEQLFFIWNFRKEIIIGFVEMKNRINKFIVTPNKAEHILFLGEHYLKYYEANFTNKIIKENSLNIVPMKIEKESNFVDIEYTTIKNNQGQNSEIFVLITDNTNSIFVFEKNVLKHKLIDQFKPQQKHDIIRSDDNEMNKTHESIMSDSLEIGETSDREDIARGEDHLRVKSYGTNLRKNIQGMQLTKKKKENDGLNMNNLQKSLQIGGATYKIKGEKKDKNEAMKDQNKDENNYVPDEDQQDIIFQKIVVTQKGFIIGTTCGYIICYEFKNDYEPKFINKIHISNKAKAIASISLSKGNVQNDDYMLAITGVYQKEVKRAFKKSGDNGESQNLRTFSRRSTIFGKKDSPMKGGFNFFMPKFIKSPQKQRKLTQDRNNFDSRKKTFSQTLQSSASKIKQEDNNVSTLFGPGEFEEKQEFFIVNMKAIQTQQQNKIVEKVFSKGAHDASIFQIAQCKNKSSFYTISESNNLKVWNHTNEWRGSSNFTLDEQPLCIDVHPSSWQIALGFKSGIKIYQSLGKELKLSFEKLGKAALSVAYSDGGQLLVCTNAVYIDVIDPIRLQLVVTLFGHKGLVRTLNWTLNSKYLISTCSNGSLFFWRGNFKEQSQKIKSLAFNPDDVYGNNNQSQTIQPIGIFNDKSYLYTSLAYDDELDTVIALSSISTLRLLINFGQEPIHEEDLLSLTSIHQEGGYGIGQSSKASSMAFSKQLNIIVIAFSSGKLSIVSWPIIKNLRVFKYDIMLQCNPITDVRIQHSSRYIMASTDDGNLYVLETYKSIEGLERSWAHENQEKLTLQKKRETYGLSGFSITDNIIMCNKEVLTNVNKKIDKLKMLKKSQEVNHEIKKRKTEKKYDKQMKMIGKELQEELEKQQRMMTQADQQFVSEKEKLKSILEDQTYEHLDEKNTLIEGKEKNLNFVSNENDELETRILRLKETIVDELEKIEDEHQNAVNELIETYEQSVRQAQEEVRHTIDKLKQNGQYYENMVKLQEKDYEQEVSKLQSDLIEEHADFMKKKEKLENDDNQLKDDYQNLEYLYKERNTMRKDKLSQVQEMAGEYKSMFSNLERLGEKNIQSNVFIEEKEQTAFDTVNEKKQLENIIVFLSEKIKELKNERMPLDERKKQLEAMIQDTYRELQDDFQFRKYLELKHESLEKKMEMIKKEIIQKEELKESIESKNYVFKRELSYLADGQSLKGWTHKMQGMLKCMSDVYFAKSAEEVKNISTAFIHIAEIMESNARPYRPSQGDDDNFAKQSKLNEMELAYYRNKNSQKMEEMQIRFQALFSQMEKAVKKLRNDNIKLIEEFNTLINEKKKLNNLRRMIKESLREFLGDKYEEDKHGSSEDDGYQTRGKKKKRLRQKSHDISDDFKQDQHKQMQHQISENTAKQIQSLSRSKSSNSFAIKHAQILKSGQNYTARDNAQDREGIQFPDLRQRATNTINLGMDFGGSRTARDAIDGQTSQFMKKNVLAGFNLGKTQQLMHKRRVINNALNSNLNQTQSTQELGHHHTGSKYLERIVDEFEKNKRQIEEQTKALQKIQSLAQVFSQSNNSPTMDGSQILVQNQQVSMIQNQNQHSMISQRGGAVPAVPSLNLKKMKLKNEPSKQSITTRIPVTTERTQSIVSLFHQSNNNPLNTAQTTHRQLPQVKEHNTLNSRESKDTKNL